VVDVDRYLNNTVIAYLSANGYIDVVPSTGAELDRPIATYATASLPTAADVAVGTVVFDSDRERCITQISDAWVTELTVTSDTAANLALLSPPTNAIAHNTDTGTANYYTGAAWVTGHISDPISVQAGTPVAGGSGLCTYNTTTGEFLVDTTGVPNWDSIMVGASGTIAAPPASAAAAAGGMYWNTDTNRMSVHDGTNWIHHNVVTRDTDVNIAAITNPVAGNIAWSTDLSRFSIYTGAAWDAETTVGMYATGAATALNGVLVRDPTGFANNEVGRGFIQVYDTTAFGGAAWVNLDYVIRSYATTAAFPTPADVPEGTLAYDQAGAGGKYVHIRDSTVNWVAVC
jgi:hypothetical protein